MLPQYRKSQLWNGVYEIYLYPDDPAWNLAYACLHRRAFTVLAAGYCFIGTKEDFDRFEAGLLEMAGKI